MKYIKPIICIVILLFSVNVNAQRLTFSSVLGYFNNDKNLSEISKVWQSYINAIDTNADTSHFWINGKSDIHLGLHKDGLLNTYNIRKLTDTIYEINTIAYYPNSAIKGGLINSIYKVCAIHIGNNWRLMNYFDAIKSRCAQFHKGCVEFYIGSGAAVDYKAMRKSTKFANAFVRDYNLINNLIVYITGSSIDECASMIGLTYTPIRSHKRYAGRTINNIVLSTRLDHIHEIVHAIMLPLYPNAPLFLHEGIAAYYGGASEKDYKDIPLSNIVAAAIIEHTLQQGGEREVLRLFEATNLDQVFELLNIANNERAEFIRSLF